MREYKIVSRLCDASGEWTESLEAEVNGLAEFGWTVDRTSLSDSRAMVLMVREVLGMKAPPRTNDRQLAAAR